ncbi:hydrogenase formation protein HypD [bacterium]|nr:hydrogenase formation protein HypD [bacterium]
MTDFPLEEFVSRLKGCLLRPVKFMEVCGTHTVSISRLGIRGYLLPDIRLISGPGCPVCVTTDEELSRCIGLSYLPDVIIATFGDMVRVPAGGTTLLERKAEGADVRIVYSPFDAVELAEAFPSKKVVFLGVGFETTAPGVGAALIEAEKRRLSNIFILSFFKTMPPALLALVSMQGFAIDGFILPGHVSVIIGTEPYRFLVEEYRIPSVVTGFDGEDIIRSLFLLARMVSSGKPMLLNEYSRVVRPDGNEQAKRVMDTVFVPVDACWRELGVIPGSGLGLSDRFARFDAGKNFDIPQVPSEPPPGCICGKVIIGAALPSDCPNFGTACTPQHPVGPCMISSEGACAAYYKYGL